VRALLARLDSLSSDDVKATLGQLVVSDPEWVYARVTVRDRTPRRSLLAGDWTISGVQELLRWAEETGWFPKNALHAGGQSGSARSHYRRALRMTAKYGFLGSRTADFTSKKDLSLVRQKGRRARKDPVARRLLRSGDDESSRHDRGSRTRSARVTRLEKARDGAAGFPWLRGR